VSLDYLVRFGARGDLGRFQAEAPLPCRRGDWVVVRSPRGLELAEVVRLLPAGGDAWPDPAVGEVVRPATADDEQGAAGLRARSQSLFARAEELAHDLALPVAVLDAEVLLDGRHAALHSIRLGPADVRQLVSALAREFDLRMSVIDLTTEEPGGCGEHGCGSGGCGSCSTGGCGSSCSSGMSPEEVRAYFAGLREQMDRRVSLL
jgi:hypothetical protein